MNKSEDKTHKSKKDKKDSKKKKSKDNFKKDKKRFSKSLERTSTSPVKRGDSSDSDSSSASHPSPNYIEKSTSDATISISSGTNIYTAPYWSQSLYASSPAVITAGSEPHDRLPPAAGQGDELVKALPMPYSPQYMPYFTANVFPQHGPHIEIKRVDYPELITYGSSSNDQGEGVIVHLILDKKQNSKVLEDIALYCQVWSPGANVIQQQGTITKIQRKETSNTKKKLFKVSARFNLRSLFVSSMRQFPTLHGENIVRGLRFFLSFNDSFIDEWPRNKMGGVAVFKTEEDYSLCTAHLMWYIQTGPLPEIKWGTLRTGFANYYKQELGEHINEASLQFLGRKMALNETQMADDSTIIPFTTYRKSRVGQYLVLAVRTIRELKYLWDNYTLKTFLEQSDAVNVLKNAGGEVGDFLIRLPSQLARDSDTSFLAQREGANLVITLVARGTDGKIKFLKADVNEKEREEAGFIHSKADLQRVLCLRKSTRHNLHTSEFVC
jgi:hypothetical protein